MLFDQESLEVVEVNDAFLRLTEFSHEEALSLDIRTSSIMSSQETEAFIRNAFQELENEGRAQFKWMLTTKSKGLLETEITLKKFSFEGKNLVLSIIKS